MLKTAQVVVTLLHLWNAKTMKKLMKDNTQICLSTGPIELHVPMNRIIWGLNLFRQKFWDRLRGTLQQMKDVGLTIYKNAY